MYLIIQIIRRIILRRQDTHTELVCKQENVVTFSYTQHRNENSIKIVNKNYLKYFFNNTRKTLLTHITYTFHSVKIFKIKRLHFNKKIKTKIHLRYSCDNKSVIINNQQQQKKRIGNRNASATVL